MSVHEQSHPFQAVMAEVAGNVIAAQAADVDERSRFPELGYHTLASVGLLVAHLPQDVGGGGGGMATSVMAIQEVARVCGSTAAVVAATVAVSTALSHHGGQPARDRIGQIASGTHLAAWLGQPVSYTSTREGYLLQGRSAWVSNADRAGSLVVAAEAGHGADPGAALLLVEAGQAGVRIGALETDLGLRGCSQRSVELKDVLVSPAHLLAEGASARAGQNMVAANHELAVAAVCVGIAAGALDQARSYVLERVQFGRPIASFPAMRAMLAEAFIRVEAARQLVKVAADLLDCGAAPEHVISAALLSATETAAEVTVDAVQAFGGYGYVRGYPVERMMRDAHVARLLIDSRAARLESVAAHFLT
jgi:butyryl-CoA dehydrogenase